MQDPQNLHLSLDARTLDYVAQCIQQHPAAAAAIAQAESQRVMQVISDQVRAQQPEQLTGQKDESPEGLNGASGLSNGAAGGSASAAH